MTDAPVGSGGSPRRVAFSALGLLALLLPWLLALGAAPLFDVDEGAFGEASREMVNSGDWGHTTLNGADRFDKPILVYWLQASSLALLGANEFALRLPSALCGFAMCFALALFAAPRCGRRVAGLAAGMLATCVGPLLIGRAATADALLNLLLVLAIFDLWRFGEGEGADARPLRRAAVWIGLGLLTKGPVAVLVPGAALLLWLATAPRGDAAAGLPARRRLLLKRLADGPAWLLGVAVAAPWYAYALHRHGWAFVDGFLLQHNVQRFSGPMEGHGGSLLYYLWVLPLLMLPWSALLPLVLARARRSWADGLGRFLLLWAAFVLVFFSLSGTKLPHYALYGLVPLVLLAALALDQAPRAWIPALACTALLLQALALASPWLAAWAAQQPMDAHWQARLAAARPMPAWQQQSLVAGALAVIGLAVWAWMRAEASRRAPLLLALAAVPALALVGVTVPWWGTTLQEPVKALALQARAAEAPLVQWRLHQPSAGFYRQQPAPRRAPEPGEWALMRSDRFRELPADEQATLKLQAEDRGFVLLQRRPP